MAAAPIASVEATSERRLARYLRAFGTIGFCLPLVIAGCAWSGKFAAEDEAFALPPALVLGMATLGAAALSAHLRDAVGALMLAVFGTFWLSWAVLRWMLDASFVSVGVDLAGLQAAFFVSWALVAALVLVAASDDTFANLAMLTGAAVSWLLLGYGAGAERLGWAHAGGWTALGTAVLGGYIVLATVLNEAWHGRYLPLGDLSERAPARAVSAAWGRRRRAVSAEESVRTPPVEAPAGEPVPPAQRRAVVRVAPGERPRAATNGTGARSGRAPTRAGAWRRRTAARR